MDNEQQTESLLSNNFDVKKNSEISLIKNHEFQGRAIYDLHNAWQKLMIASEIFLLSVFSFFKAHQQERERLKTELREKRSVE